MTRTFIDLKPLENWKRLLKSVYVALLPCPPPLLLPFPSMSSTFGWPDRISLSCSCTCIPVRRDCCGCGPRRLWLLAAGKWDVLLFYIVPTPTWLLSKCSKCIKVTLKIMIIKKQTAHENVLSSEVKMSLFQITLGRDTSVTDATFLFLLFCLFHIFFLSFTYSFIKRKHMFTLYIVLFNHVTCFLCLIWTKWRQWSSRITKNRHYSLLWSRQKKQNALREKEQYIVMCKSI